MRPRRSDSMILPAIVAALALALPGLAGPTDVDADAAVATGTVRVRVLLVASDLSVRPVPKRRFRIVPDVASGDPFEATTGFDGEFATELPVGRYRITDTSPLDFEGRQYSWDVPFEIAVGGETALELSNDNATVAAPDRGLTDSGELYRTRKDGVFKVVSDGGHGSGFLVDSEGLILTNRHVVLDATYLAVKVDAAHKYEAVVVAEDPERDLAVLRVNAIAIAGRPVLELADDAADRPPVAVGDAVLAIGNPLTTETILTSGLVSKVEREAIYSDVNINPGNSGGPLFDAGGRVIGISTFALQAQRGPGVAGMTRIYLARPLLDTARERTASAEPPSARMLPVESPYRLPAESIKAMALATDRTIDDYHLEAGKFDVHLITSTLMASTVIRSEREAVAGRAKRRRKQDAESEQPPYEPGQRFYAWQQDADNFRPVVIVRVYPEVKVKAGSVFKSLGTSAKYRFKTDFLRMELRRDGAIVEPIHPGRVREVVDVRQGTASMTDVGYWGYYEYPPEAFEAGAVVTLHIREQDVAEPVIVTVPDTLVTMVREDLGPYFDAGAAR